MVSSDDGATIYACDAKKAVIYMIENSHAVPVCIPLLDLDYVPVESIRLIESVCLWLLGVY